MKSACNPTTGEAEAGGPLELPASLAESGKLQVPEEALSQIQRGQSPRSDTQSWTPVPVLQVANAHLKCVWVKQAPDLKMMRTECRMSLLFLHYWLLIIYWDNMLNITGEIETVKVISIAFLARLIWWTNYVAHNTFVPDSVNLEIMIRTQLIQLKLNSVVPGCYPQYHHHHRKINLGNIKVLMSTLSMSTNFFSVGVIFRWPLTSC